jgi:flagellar capping protein FliD
MVGPIRFPGVFSGIDFNSIIEALLAAQRTPILNLQNRIQEATDTKTALLSVSAKLLGIRSITTQLQKPSFLNRTLSVSSNESILTARGDQVGVTGAFTFKVEQLASTHQLVSNGFAGDTDVVTSTAAEIRVEVGNGFVDRQTPLALLNGGAGVDRGFIKVTDTSGAVAVIDLQGVRTVQDVLDRINTNTQVSVRAQALSDRLVVQDLAGGGGTLSIENFGLDTTASDLGLVRAATIVDGTATIFGEDVHYASDTTALRFLNDGLGVRRNADGAPDFTIVTASGATISVDLRAADLTLGDAIDRINAAAATAGSTLTASLNEDRTGLLLRTDGGAGATSITAAADSLAAADLGLGHVSGLTFVGITARLATNGAAAANGALFVGHRLIGGLNSILRRTLNGGQSFTDATDLQGVRDGSLTVTDRQGDAVTVNLDRRTYATLAVSAAAGATGVTLTDADGFAVGNKVRFVGGTGAGGSLTTRTITRISGTTIFFDRALDAAYDVGDAAYANNESLADIVTNVNTRAGAAGVDVALRVNDSGNGLLARDTSGGTGTLSIAGAGGFVAADLGIDGAATGSVLEGGDLDPQYVGDTTLLSTLNSGRGVQAGKIRVRDTNGIQFDVDLSQPDDTTIGKIIKDFNGAAAGASSDVRARVNDTGDGILLSSSAPGTGVLTVGEIGTTTTARDLNLLGSAPAATPDRIDGSFERVVAIAAGTKVKDLARLLNEAGVGVQAALINDGGAIDPYKLTVLSKTAGTPGRVVLSTDIAGLRFATTTAARDAVVLYGVDGGLSDPLVITSTSNSIKDVVPGLTLDLKSASDETVTVTVKKDLDAVIDQVQKFVDNYNAAVDEIRDQTQFDPDTNQTGLLFSENVIRTVRRDLAALITSPVDEIPAGDLRTFRQIGVKVEKGGKLSFDSGVLRTQLENNFDQVVEFLTKQRPLKVDTPLEDLNSGLGVGNVSGKDDFRVIKRNGDYFDVDIDGITTLGSLLNAINNDAGNGGEVTASISPDGFSIRLTDGAALGRTADGGSTTTLQESDLVGSPVTFVGPSSTTIARITITSGPDAGEVRFVTAFDASTGTFTLDSALSTTTSGVSYTLERAPEVASLNDSTAAPDLRIAKRAALGENVLIGGLINLSDDPGKAFEVSDRLDFLTTGEDGLIPVRTQGIDDTIEGFNKSIERLETKVQKQEELLIRQFSLLERQIASSQQIIAQLQAQQAGLLSLAGGGFRFGSR